MVEVNLTAEDRKILTEANNLYLFDWRKNDADEKTAGWRHPGYFLEVNEPFDFEKLVRAGLMERGTVPDYVTYRISERGMEEVAKIEAQSAPLDSTAAADVVAQIRADQETRRAFYSSGGPGFKQSSDAIDTLLTHIGTLQDDLAAALVHSG